MRKINEINIHCSATRPEWMAGRPGADKVAEIRRWHIEQNKWRDLGYHWLIDRDGRVYPGRDESAGGAFEPKVNATAVGICLIGGFGSAATDAFDQHYTREQDIALRELIHQIADRHPSVKKVTGHNDYSPKACPGFKVARWLDNKPAQRSFVQSGTAQGTGAALVAGGGLAVVELVPLLTATTSDVRSAVDQARAVDGADPLRWVLICLILLGAAFGLWRRWADWQAGRK